MDIKQLQELISKQLKEVSSGEAELNEAFFSQIEKVIDEISELERLGEEYRGYNPESTNKMITHAKTKIENYLNVYLGDVK